MVILKGMAIAFYYADDPAIRVMEDIDVLVDQKRAKSVLKFLEQFHIIAHGVKPNRLAQRCGYVERFRIAFNVLSAYGVLIPEGVLQQIVAIPFNSNEINHFQVLNKLISTELGIVKKSFYNLALFYWQHRIYQRGIVSLFFLLPLHCFYRLLNEIIKKRS